MFANLVVELKKHHYSQRGLAAHIGISESSMNDKQPIVGAAVLMFQRGDKLLGFTKHVADTICSEWL